MSKFSKIVPELIGQFLAGITFLFILMSVGLELKWAVPMALIILKLDSGLSKN